MNLHKLACYPGVFTGNDIGTFENLQGPECDVGRIADRCGDDIKTLCQLLWRFTRFGQEATVSVVTLRIDWTRDR